MYLSICIAIRCNVSPEPSGDIEDEEDHVSVEESTASNLYSISYLYTYAYICIYIYIYIYIYVQRYMYRCVYVMYLLHTL